MECNATAISEHTTQVGHADIVFKVGTQWNRTYITNTVDVTLSIRLGIALKFTVRYWNITCISYARNLKNVFVPTKPIPSPSWIIRIGFKTIIICPTLKFDSPSFHFRPVLFFTCFALDTFFDFNVHFGGKCSLLLFKLMVSSSCVYQHFSNGFHIATVCSGSIDSYFLNV